MDSESYCRRCSVIRVNTLCNLYDEGFRDNIPKSKEKLIMLVELAGKRGYPDGSKILSPFLSSSYIRKYCWNISSLLKDKDFQQCGVPLNGR